MTLCYSVEVARKRWCAFVTTKDEYSLVWVSYGLEVTSERREVNPRVRRQNELRSFP